MLTFVIVNYNKPELTEKCLRALYTHCAEFNCVVVDNGSTKENREALENTLRNFVLVRYASIEKNEGYAPGANAGIECTPLSNDVVLLNNDCFITCDAVKIIEKTFEETQAGVIGALLHYPDGGIQHDGMDFMPRVPGAFVHGHKAEPRPSRFCVSVTGAFFVIRRELLNTIGALDTSFYLGCEDSDFCIRSWVAEFPVWFEQSLTATHIEGATRGRTPTEKRKAAGDAKFAREVSSVKMFRAKHKDIIITGIDAHVKKLNRDAGIHLTVETGIKIDVGCGNNPTPGYVACDARKLRSVQHTFDFGNDRWPFKDNTVSEIIMNHSIEHVSYRRLPHVLTEAARVLSPGGKIIIRTPDLRFIASKYLADGHTPEFPPDEDFIAANFGANARHLSPGWWANLKLFSGQDYPGNEHRFCFDFETLAGVLANFGFASIARRSDKPVLSPGEIYCEAVRV